MAALFFERETTNQSSLAVPSSGASDLTVLDCCAEAIRLLPQLMSASTENINMMYNPSFPILRNKFIPFSIQQVLCYTKFQRLDVSKYQRLSRQA